MAGERIAPGAPLSEFDKYQAKCLRSTISAAYHKDPSRLLAMRGHAKLQVAIQADGSIAAVKVLERSDPAFAKFVERAVRAAAPFDPPPEQSPVKSGVVQITLPFRVTPAA